MTRTVRFTAGFLVAPFVVATSLALFQRADGHFDPVGALGLVPIFYFFALLATAVFAAPLFVLLHRLKAANIWSLISIGALTGVLAAVAMTLPEGPQARDMLFTAPIGAVSAFVFWLFWRRAD
jgi:hypothetical protein